MNKTLNYILISLLIINFLIIGIFSYLFIPKINYANFLTIKQKERLYREDEKNIKLQKELVLFVKNYNFRENINLNLYKNYFTTNGKYCDVSDNFFLGIEYKLKSKNIIYKPKLEIDNKLKINGYKNLGKEIKLDNLKHNICNFINSNNQTDYIEIELENYEYSKKEIDELNDYKLVGNYTINKYYKTPIESVLNSQSLIEKISYELIYPNENISVLENLLKNGGDDLLKSNILKDGEIIKGIGGGSCLASTIIYRTLLNAGIDIKSQKTHNIYYENIYGTGEIGLDATIYEDGKYFVDLIFQNNYKNNIILIPKFDDNKITLNIYSKEKEYSTKLIPVDTKNVSNIKWNYEIFDKNNNKISQQDLISKYDRVDNF
ncbi:MAG: VanW family protein [Candidatus Gracilibacteria bacterium]|nr:VanW family protein [Candidatus Gracilibacteria bacterium]